MVIIYPNLGESFSMNRYAQGLVKELHAGKVAYKLAVHNQHDSRFKRLIQKYLFYPLIALSLRNNDRHIIISERFAYLSLFLPKRKTVVICHDLHTLYPEEGNGWLHKNLYRFQLQVMGRRAKTVAISTHTANDLRKYMSYNNSHSIEIIPNGLEQFWFKEKGFLPSDSTKPYLLAVGTDAWYKNFELILEVLEKLPAQYQLIKVGGIVPNNLERIRNLGLGSRVIQKQCISDEELKDLYDEAHCLILPSLSEGFGWPAVEAMASGCPVVTSGKGSINEVCEEAVLYADTGIDYQRAIESLENQELRAAYIKKGKVQAKKYSWDLTTRRILEL